MHSVPDVHTAAYDLLPYLAHGAISTYHDLAPQLRPVFQLHNGPCRGSCHRIM